MFMWLMYRGWHKSLVDMRAAVELLKEVYCAESRGLAPSGINGLIFETEFDVSPEDQIVLGIMPFV